MKLDDFLAKIEWEGGAIEALEYGLRASDIDPTEDSNIRGAWERLEDLYEQMKPSVDEMQRLIEEWYSLHQKQETD